MSPFILILLTAAALSAAVGQLLFRVGAAGREDIMGFLNLSIVGGLFFYAISTVAWIYALSREPLVNVYAFTALTFVLVYAGGVFLLGEAFDIKKGLGVVTVLAGLYLIVTPTGSA